MLIHQACAYPNWCVEYANKRFHEQIISHQKHYSKFRKKLGTTETTHAHESHTLL